MTKFAMVGIFLFIPLVMCRASIKVEQLLDKVTSRVLGQHEISQTRKMVSQLKRFSRSAVIEKQINQGKKPKDKSRII